MSSASHAHAHDAHDAHEDHTFAGEPVTALPPDEPRTPGWIPVLGIALFAAAAVWALSGSSDSPAKSGNGEAAPEPVAAAPQRIEMPVRPQAAPVPPPTTVPRPQVTAAPEGSARKLTKEETDVLKQRIERARQNGALPKDFGKRK
jgi:hypothetical protein